MQTVHEPLIDLDMAKAIGVLGDADTQRVFHSLLGPDPVSVPEIVTKLTMESGIVFILLTRLSNSGLVEESGNYFAMTEKGKRICWALKNSRI